MSGTVPDREKVRGFCGVGEEEWQLPGDSCIEELGVTQQPLSVSDNVLSCEVKCIPPGLAYPLPESLGNRCNSGIFWAHVVGLLWWCCTCCCTLCVALMGVVRFSMRRDGMLARDCCILKGIPSCRGERKGDIRHWS